MKHNSRSFDSCFLLFTSSFVMKTPNQTFEGYMYKVDRRKRGLPFVRHRKHVARHRNYRLVLSLRSRYRQKAKNRLPPKIYRHVLVLPPPPKSLPPKNEKPPTAKKLPPYGITAEQLPPHFGSTASAKVVTADNRKSAYRRKMTAVWHYRR